MDKYLLFILFILFLGCIDQTKLDIPNSERMVIIEANLTNENTENYVKLSYSAASNNKTSEAIHGALIIISDDLNQVDTLKEIHSDTMGEGYYFPRKLNCKTGRTYFLTVNVSGNIYTSSSYMPDVPTIDSVIVQYVRSDVEKMSGYQPIFYFTDPSTTNDFYLTKLCFIQNRFSQSNINCSINNRVWNFAIFSDEFLLEKTVGININVGHSPSSYYIQNLENGLYDARLYSLTRESYNFYKSLIDSFRNDGGAYSPNPATAPSNIKGGAIGFFNTSSVSVMSFKVEN